MSIDECSACHKTFNQPKRLGSRLHCPFCGAYLGAKTDKPKASLPPTWWRNKTGERRVEFR